MARKTIGYVELEWVCPNCKRKNSGTKKVCEACGSPQPSDIAFQRAQQEKLIEKEDIKQAALSADIHCGFCGARNVSDAKICSQCSADLTAGKARDSGQVVGAFEPSMKEQEIKCRHCASMNPGNYHYCRNCGASFAEPSKPLEAIKTTEKKRSPLFFIAIGLAIVVGCGLLAYLGSGLFKRDTFAGTVEQVYWQRSIAIEELGPVQHQDWKSEIPTEAQIVSCEKRFHHTQNEPAPDAQEVCGTSYIVDKGSGYGEVVQDCEYRVMLDYCDYTVTEWVVVDRIALDGYNLDAVWPDPNLSQGQRLGQKEEKYLITFSSSNGNYEYTTADEYLFEQAIPGSSWKLTVNGFNAVVSIEPNP